jgi:hypothetical protein
MGEISISAHLLQSAYYKLLHLLLVSKNIQGDWIMRNVLSCVALPAIIVLYSGCDNSSMNPSDILLDISDINNR